MLENNITDVLDLTFTEESDYFGKKELVELKPGGKDIRSAWLSQLCNRSYSACIYCNSTLSQAHMEPHSFTTDAEMSDTATVAGICLAPSLRSPWS